MRWVPATSFQKTTTTTKHVLNNELDPFTSHLNLFLEALRTWTDPDSLPNHLKVQIEQYVPYVNSPSSWLQVLEGRIKQSIRPTELSGEHTSEWLNDDAANTALAFFRAGADLLPAEPHIYATVLISP